MSHVWIPFQCSQYGGPLWWCRTGFDEVNILVLVVKIRVRQVLDPFESSRYPHKELLMGQVVLLKVPLSFVFTLTITRFELKDVYIFQPHQVSIVKLNTIIFFRESNAPLYYGGESGIPRNLLLWHSFNNQLFLDSNNQFLQRHPLYYLIF